MFLFRVIRVIINLIRYSPENCTGFSERNPMFLNIFEILNLIPDKG